ncbi:MULTISPECIES: hypothetical protein [unclassified Streptomyces]|uniref:hypothetical protein n=1 Tax=unclassified Streptomyces TaxID=2593676 RepID=UPI0033B7BBF8
MSDGLYGLFGVILGLVGSVGISRWSQQQARRDQREGRLAAREEEAAREVRQALTSVHHLKSTLSGRERTGGPDELFALIHTIDSAALVLASEELRRRLDQATTIMWHWHVLHGAEGHPLWIAAEDASRCLGAYLRGEKLTEETQDVRALADEVAALNILIDEYSGDD